MTDRRTDVAVDRVSEAACPHCGADVDVSPCEPLVQIECPACGRVMTVPGRLGSFVLLEMLGKGGMGAVYRALDTTLNRQVAIKVMRGSLGHNLQFSADLANEARAAAALNHPNVAQVYAFGEEKGQPYIVMELAAGGRLDKMIKEQGPADEAWALNMAWEVAQGLQAAFEAGLIHADVKPANIVFDEKGTAKVVDFGLAQSAAHVVEGGESWGTPFYVAPEQAKKQKIDHRADIYGLGATLFHTLAGRAPFDEGDALATVRARFERPAPDLRSIRPELGEDTARIVARMLVQARAKRYPTYASLLADLSAARNTPRARPDPKTTHREGPKPSKPKKNRALPLILIAAFGVVTAVMFIMLGRVSDAPRRSVSPPPSIPEPKESGVAEPTDAKLFAQAAESVAAGKNFAAAQQLQALRRSAGPGDPLLPWIRFLLAFSAWTDSVDFDVARHLAELIEDGEVTRDEEIPHDLARFMAGALPADELLLKTEGWALDGRALASLVVGASGLRAGDANASVALQRYLDTAPDLEGWVGTFTPLAERWIRDDAQCRDAKAKIASVAAEQKEQAWAALRADVAPVFHAALNREIDAARQFVNDKSRRKRVAEDEQRLAGLEDELSALVKARAFEEAPAVADKVRASIKTKRLLPRVDELAAPSVHLAELKSYLIGRIEAYPPRGAVPGLGRALAGADAEGITLMGGGAVIPWAQVNTRAWLALFDYYLARSDLPQEEQAKLFLSCAIFCDVEGGPKSALTYAQEAIKRKPALKQEARRLLPDLVWPK